MFLVSPSSINNPHALAPALYKALSRLAESPVRCLQLFNESFTHDYYQDRKVYRLPLPPEAATAHIPSTLAVDSSLPLAGGLFNWGRNVVYYEGELSTDPNDALGAGTGVAVNTPSRDITARDNTLDGRVRLLLHWPSILASARKGFALYPPAAYLALSVLPIVRTYSIAMYEYTLHQCAVALFAQMHHDAGTPVPLDKPELLSFLERIPEVNNTCRQISMQYTNCSPADEVYNVPELYADILKYLKAACGGAVTKLSRNVGGLRDLKGNFDVATSMDPHQLAQAEHPWYPYVTPELFALSPLSVVDDLTVLHTARHAGVKDFCALKTYIPTHKTAPLAAAALNTPRHGFLETVEQSSYANQFITELGECVAAASKRKLLPFVACWLTTPGAEAETLYDYFMAVNWERAKYVLPFFYLRGLLPGEKHVYLDTDLTNLEAAAMKQLTPDLAHPFVAKVDDGTHRFLGGSEDVFPYLTMPANHYQQHLYRVAGYLKGSAATKALQKKAKKGYGRLVTRVYREIDEGKRPTVQYMTKGIQVTSLRNGFITTLQLYVMVQRRKNKAPQVLFHILGEDCFPTVEKFYKLNMYGERTYALTEGFYDWSAHREELDANSMPIPHPVFGTFHAVTARTSPWSWSPHMVQVAKVMSDIVNYTPDMLYRWIEYGDARALAPMGRPPKLLNIANVADDDLSLDALISKYLRPWMTKDEYKYLLFFSNTKFAEGDIAARAKKLRVRMFKSGIKDIAAFPLKRYDLRFRKEYLKYHGISLSMNEPIVAPDAYRSILELQKKGG